MTTKYLKGRNLSVHNLEDLSIEDWFVLFNLHNIKHMMIMSWDQVIYNIRNQSVSAIKVNDKNLLLMYDSESKVTIIDILPEDDSGTLYNMMHFNKAIEAYNNAYNSYLNKEIEKVAEYIDTLVVNAQGSNVDTDFDEEAFLETHNIINFDEESLFYKSARINQNESMDSSEYFPIYTKPEAVLDCDHSSMYPSIAKEFAFDINGKIIDSQKPKKKKHKILNRIKKAFKHFFYVEDPIGGMEC